MWMMLGVVLACAVALETAIRVLYFVRRGKFPLYAPMRWAGYREQKPDFYAEHPNLGFRKKCNLTTDVLPTNNLGFAGRVDLPAEKGDAFRIYVCGDSTTEQNDLDRLPPFDPEFTWPSELERLLNLHCADHSKARRVQVHNAATAGYTSIEMMIDLQIRGLHLDPDMVLLYPGINDIYSAQLVAGFVSDYTHSRIPARLPRRSHWPIIRLSFAYQLVKMRYLTAQNALLPYIVRRYPFETDLSRTAEKLRVFESNVRNLCAVCVARNIVPVLIPWNFPNERLGRPYGHALTDEQMTDFRALLIANRESLRRVSEEFESAVYLDLGVFDDECFRRADWTHWSKAGLAEMGRRTAAGLMPHVLERA